MRVAFLICIAMLVVQTHVVAQNSKAGHSFGKTMISDSSSTLLIPTRYEASFFTSNKVALWGDVYSNIIFYNFINDSAKKLFAEDTYILSLDQQGYYYRESKSTKGITPKWIIYRVMNVDRNKNDKIDNDDPVILYVSDLHGNQLRALTSKDENVVDFEIYEKQNIAMIKIQRDSNKDFNFTAKDTSYYYVKLDLTSLSFGKKIELR